MGTAKNFSTVLCNMHKNLLLERFYDNFGTIFAGNMKKIPRRKSARDVGFGGSFRKETAQVGHSQHRHQPEGLENEQMKGTHNGNARGDGQEQHEKHTQKQTDIL